MVSCAVMGLLVLLHPLDWVSPVIPMLPMKLMDFVESPVPILVGLTLAHNESIIDRIRAIFQQCGELLVMMMRMMLMLVLMMMMMMLLLLLMMMMNVLITHHSIYATIETHHSLTPSSTHSPTHSSTHSPTLNRSLYHSFTLCRW